MWSQPATRSCRQICQIVKVKLLSPMSVIYENGVEHGPIYENGPENGSKNLRGDMEPSEKLPSNSKADGLPPPAAPIAKDPGAEDLQLYENVGQSETAEISTAANGPRAGAIGGSLTNPTVKNQKDRNISENKTGNDKSYQ